MDDEPEKSLTNESFDEDRDASSSMPKIVASLQIGNSLAKTLKNLRIVEQRAAKFSNPIDELRKSISQWYTPFPLDTLTASLKVTQNDLSDMIHSFDSIRTDTLLKASMLESQREKLWIAKALKEVWHEPLLNNFNASVTMTSGLKKFLKSEFVSNLSESKIFDTDLKEAFDRVIEVPDGSVIRANPEESISEPEIDYQGSLKLDYRTLKRFIDLITYLVTFIQFMVYVNAAWEMVVENLDDTDKVASIPQAKHEVRKAPWSEWDVEGLKYIRVTTGHNIRLRTGPSLSSEIITELPKFQWLNVIDKSNRTWLEVNVKVGDEVLTGWVSRRYTKHLH